MTDDELRAEIRELHRHFESATAEIRRHFDVTTEELKRRDELLAEAIAHLDEKIDRKVAALTDEMRTGFAETHALIRTTPATRAAATPSECSTCRA